MSSPQTLVERSEAAQNELKKIRRHFQIGSWITGIVGFAILAVLAVYFSYGYSEISDLKDPKYIVSLVGQLIDDQIPQARKRIENQVDDNAAAWAQQASDRVVAAIPAARKQLENLAGRQADKAIDHLNVMGEKKFREVLDKNRDTMKKALEDLEADDEISDGVLELLEIELAKGFQMDMEALAGAPLVIVGDLNKNGKTLLEAENLSVKQEHERRVLMLVRRLQNMQFPNLKVKSPTISPEITGSLKQLEHASLDKKKAAGKTAEPSKEEAAKPEAKEAAEVKAVAKPEAKKADPPKKAEADKLSDDKKVAEAKPADK